jgi:hypothetical protein
MKRNLLPIAIVVLIGGARAAAAWQADAAAVPNEQPIAAAAPGAAPDSASSPQPATGEAWRYQRHDGLWWYWLPSEKWVYWTGDAWRNYDRASYSQFHASRSRRSYSYSGGGDWGRWGPVRYNSYGQVQYPYSRRTRGIKQLGPVPAMGGVRSLPGWGGER